MGIEAVIFDWSGTLSDDREAIYRANRTIFVRYGIEPLDYDTWLENATGTAEAFYESQGITDPDVVKKSNAYFNEFVDSGLWKPQMYPDVISVLDELQNINLLMGVISAHPPNNLESEAAEYGVDNYFEFLEGGVKDKTQRLEEIRDERKINPENAVYVGDTEFDMRSAIESGYIPFGVGKKVKGHRGNFRGYNSPERLRTVTENVFDDLYDLIPFISQL